MGLVPGISGEMVETLAPIEIYPLVETCKYFSLLVIIIIVN